jgi:ribosomal protein S6--L-glutamate ligase
MAKIGLGMYDNDGGAVIEARLTASLEALGHRIVGKIDLSDSATRDGRVYTQDGRDLSELDVFFFMDADRQSLNQVDQLHALERSGVQVINAPGAYGAARDKPTANQILRNVGINVPRSALLTPKTLARDAAALIRDWGALVLKPRVRHGGYGIVCFTDAGQLADFCQVETSVDNYYCEEFIPFGDLDMRVEIAAGMGIGGYSRRRTHAFKTNVSSGGIMTPNPPDSALCTLAEDAARAIGLDYSIVDFLRDERNGRVTVVEVNPILGIFVEEAMRVSPKTSLREVDPSYALDARKLEILADHLDRLARVPVAERRIA